MRRRGYAQPFVVAAALAVGLAAVACNNTGTRTNAKGEVVGTSGTADKNASMTVTGCLQKGGGLFNDYIVTEPVKTSPVGTSGTTSDAEKVQAEETKAAQHAYRLSGDTDALENLVGHQVRVMGTLADKADIRKDTSGAAGTSGTKDREIKESDLAKIKVSSIDDVAATCGTR